MWRARAQALRKRGRAHLKGRQEIGFSLNCFARGHDVVDDGGAATMPITKIKSKESDLRARTPS